jgi:hypothetical protein
MTNLIEIEVKVSDKIDTLVKIKVEKQLFWSSGRPFTLEDYAIMNEVKKERLNK